MLMLYFAQHEADRAKERLRQSPGRGGQKGTTKRADLLDKGETAEKLAAKAGVSRRKVQRAKRVKDEAAGISPRSATGGGFLRSGAAPADRHPGGTLTGRPKIESREFC
jgi:hypothetical protein